MKPTMIGSIGLALMLASCSAAEPATALSPNRNADPATSQSNTSADQVSTGGSPQTGSKQPGTTTGGQTKSPATGSNGGLPGGAAVDAAFAAAAKKCTGCHTGSGASGGFQLSSTDPQDWINKKAKILGRVNDEQKPMPPGGLSDTDKAAFLALVGSLKLPQ